jgi:hypothetical protein
VNALDLVADLDTITAPKIRVEINSPGGDVFDGIAIYNARRLLPADITGTDVLQEDEDNQGVVHRRVRFLAGPIFHNLILADEINRTPPKTQAALLEAMQEHHVTVGEHTLSLPAPLESWRRAWRRRRQR